VRRVRAGAGLDPPAAIGVRAGARVGDATGTGVRGGTGCRVPGAARSGITPQIEGLQGPAQAGLQPLGHTPGQGRVADRFQHLPQPRLGQLAVLAQSPVQPGGGGGAAGIQVPVGQEHPQQRPVALRPGRRRPADAALQGRLQRPLALQAGGAMAVLPAQLRPELRGRGRKGAGRPGRRARRGRGLVQSGGDPPAEGFGQPGLGPLAVRPGIAQAQPLLRAGEREVQQYREGQLAGEGGLGEGGPGREQQPVHGQARERSGRRTGADQVRHHRLQARPQPVQVSGPAGELLAHEGLEVARAAVPGLPEPGRLGQAALQPEPLVRAVAGGELGLEQAHGTVQPDDRPGFRPGRSWGRNRGDGAGQRGEDGGEGEGPHGGLPEEPAQSRGEGGQRVMKVDEQRIFPGALSGLWGCLAA
jgi:hypothetical protein